MAVYPSFGLGVGFFSPRDVNNYIKESIDAVGYSSQMGTSSMFMYFDLQGAVTFRIKQADFSAILDYAIAPKWVVVTNGDDMSFYFSRISPGLTANYYIPLKSGRHAFFVGGGIQYHYMKFESIHASSPGFRLQAGVSLQFGKFNLQPNAAFIYGQSKTASVSAFSNSDFVMNYTGMQIGVILSSHPRINYK